MNDSAVDIQVELNRKERNRQRVAVILPFTGLILITVALIIATKGMMLRSGNLINLINQCFTTCIVGVGSVFVFAHGGMDFSVGASCGLAQYACVVILSRLGLPPIFALFSAIAIAFAASTLVGTFSIVLRVPAFVISLCVRAVCAGLLAMLVNSRGGEVNIDYARYAVLNNAFLKLGVLVAIIAVGYYLFEKTAFGKAQKAIGGNETTVSHSGVNIDKVRILAYSLLGLCVGIAAFFQLIKQGSVNSQAGSGLEFDIMIAMVLGGFPMAGGSAAKLRAVIIGAITGTILSNGMILSGVDVGLINGLKGLLVIIIVAVSYDRSVIKQFNMVSV